MGIEKVVGWGLFAMEVEAMEDGEAYEGSKRAIGLYEVTGVFWREVWELASMVRSR